MTRQSFYTLLLAGTLLGSASPTFATDPKEVLDEVIAAYNSTSSGTPLHAEYIPENIKGLLLKMLSEKRSLEEGNKDALDALEAEKKEKSTLLKLNQELKSEKEGFRLQVEDLMSAPVFGPVSSPTPTPLSDEGTKAPDPVMSVSTLSEELEAARKEKDQASAQARALQEQFKSAEEQHARDLALQAAALSAAREDHEKEIALRAAEVAALKEEQAEKLRALQETMTKEIAFRHRCLEELAALIPATPSTPKKSGNELSRLGAEVGRWSKALNGIGQALNERDGSKGGRSSSADHLPPYLRAFLLVPVDFEVYRYLAMNPDVQEAAYTQTAESPEKFALAHFAFHGIKEGRAYK